MEKRLMRNEDDRLIAGVCSGLAKYLNTDPSIVRLIAVVLLFVTGGGIILAYIALAIIVPSEQATAGKASGSMQDFNTKVRKKPVSDFALNPEDYIIDEAEYKVEE
jgi:phage shock protein C